MHAPAMRALLLDNRGVGRSSSPSSLKAYSIPIMASDVLTILVRFPSSMLKPLRMARTSPGAAYSNKIFRDFLAGLYCSSNKLVCRRPFLKRGPFPGRIRPAVAFERVSQWPHGPQSGSFCPYGIWSCTARVQIESSFRSRHYFASLGGPFSMSNVKFALGLPFTSTV